MSGDKIIFELVNKYKNKVCSMTNKPKLAIIVAGGYSGASTVYVRNKIKLAAEIGIEIEMFDIDWENVSREEFRANIFGTIDILNKDDSVDGIIAQLPMPEYVTEEELSKAISKDKDVDGFHIENLGKVMRGENDGLVCCTPLGATLMMDFYGVDVKGKVCVVVGRSNILGKPLANILINKGATVIVCNSKTEPLQQYTRLGDIVFLATGNAKMFTRKYFKKDAIVIDFGMNRDEKGKLCGDLDVENSKDKLKMYSPTPGGTGKTTLLALMNNTIKVREKKESL